MNSQLESNDKDVEESVSLIDRNVHEESKSIPIPVCRNTLRKISLATILISLGVVLHVFFYNRHKIDHSIVSDKNPVEFLANVSNQSIHEKNVDTENIKPYGLDIFVIGFPKCGTGTLRALFDKSDEIAMLGHENKDLFKEGSSKKALSTLESDFEDLFKSEDINSTLIRIVKHPQGVQDMTAIKRLVKYTDTDTKLVVGVRHPIAFYQSFCNYRIRNKESVTSYEHCVHSFFNTTRFDLFMKQLSKVPVTNDEKLEMEMYVKDGLISHFDHGLEIVSNPYKVLIYHLDQIADDNVTRSEKLRRDFQEYLELKNGIDKWPKNKVTHESIPEEIHICDEQFDDLRGKILVNARIAAVWIKEKFIKSDEVIVGGHHDHFLSILDTWNFDICP